VDATLDKNSKSILSSRKNIRTIGKIHFIPANNITSPLLLIKTDMNSVAKIGSSNKNILLVVFFKIISTPDIKMIRIKIKSFNNLTYGGVSSLGLSLTTLPTKSAIISPMLKTGINKIDNKANF
jgi:hypothetical protein